MIGSRTVIFNIVKALNKIGTKFWDLMFMLCRMINHYYFQRVLYLLGMATTIFLLYALFIGLR